MMMHRHERILIYAVVLLVALATAAITMKIDKEHREIYNGIGYNMKQIMHNRSDIEQLRKKIGGRDGF